LAPADALTVNLGVEAAQLGVVALVAPLLWLLTRATGNGQCTLRHGAGYLTGCLAAMWCLERSLELFN